MAYPYPPQSFPPQPYGYPPAQPVYYSPPPPVYQPPPPQPDLNDRVQFRSYYLSGLRALVENSKTIITDLTVLANEFATRSSDIVVQLLEEHIRLVDASIKLPALYLLDSICKNIHAPYAALFAQRIERIFLSAYRDVDPPTKIKMEELLGTWRTGGPNGTELFQGRAQRDIEIALFGSQLKGGGIAGRSANANPHFLSGIQQLPSMASKAERNTVTSDLRRLQAIWEMRATMHPEDDGPRVQIDALKQLEHILNTATLTSDAIANIRADINKLHPTDSVPLITPRPVPAPSQPHLASIDFSKLAGILPIRSGSQQPSAAPTPPPSSAPPAHDPLALLRSLNLDAFKGLPGFGQALPAPAVDNSELDYEQAVLKMDMHLTASDISRYRPSAPELLYERLPLQCKQCAARFLESPSGHAKLHAHHDRHFRQKKRIREATRVQARSWFPTEEDWISPPKRQAAAEAAAAQQAAAAAPVPKVLGRVIAPKDPAKAARPCPICKERFKGEFNEAEEEFVWLDAIELDGVIYHDSCHSEMMRSRLLAATSRGTATTASSREGTPLSADARGVTPPSGSTMRKRKADEADDAATEDEAVKRVKAEEE